MFQITKKNSIIFPGWFFQIPWFFRVFGAFFKFHDFSRSGIFFLIFQISMILAKAGNPVRTAGCEDKNSHGLYYIVLLNSRTREILQNIWPWKKYAELTRAGVHENVSWPTVAPSNYFVILHWIHLSVFTIWKADKWMNSRDYHEIFIENPFRDISLNSD